MDIVLSIVLGLLYWFIAGGFGLMWLAGYLGRLYSNNRNKRIYTKEHLRTKWRRDIVFTSLIMIIAGALAFYYRFGIIAAIISFAIFYAMFATAWNNAITKADNNKDRSTAWYFVDFLLSVVFAGACLFAIIRLI